MSSWTSPELARDLHDSPVTLFELFMTNKLIDHICKGTNAYATQKGNHTFKIEPNELKSFLAVLLLNGYIPYPRRSMFDPYAGKNDNYNKDIGLGGSVVLTLMSKLPTVLNSNYHVVMDKVQAF